MVPKQKDLSRAKAVRFPETIKTCWCLDDFVPYQQERSVTDTLPKRLALSYDGIPNMV